MRAQKFMALFLVLLFAALLLLPACRRQRNSFVVSLGDNIPTLDPVGAQTVNAASERVRVLMFNTLVKKDEKFEYVADLASYQPSDEGLTYTFTLREGVTFHDGKPLTSADAKYTLDTLLTSNGGKSASFFEGKDKQPFIKSIEAPDQRTLIIRLNKFMAQLLPNLVTVGIIPQGTAATQKDHPVGSGPFKFVSWDNSQQVLDLEANENYWEGAPQIPKLRVRVIGDPNALQAELRSGRVDLAPLPTNLTPDSISALKNDPNLQVLQFPGANVNLLTINVQSAPLDRLQVRQAIAYAIDRESLIKDLLLGQGQIAHSIIPENSWAYTSGKKYSYDPEQAKKLLDEAGFRDPDGEGPRMRFDKPLVLKISSASTSARNYASVIQDNLKRVGIPLQIDPVEFNTMLSQLVSGQFQINYGQWVGGNTDPIFLRDLFATSEIPTKERPSRNRGRYSNPAFDKLIEQAVLTIDRPKAASLYSQAQDIISNDVPVFPLWYQANMIIARKGVGNIQVRPDGDWEFVRKLTLENK
ncbi:MAG TPA: ABC transporter substrate-binding protein [Pyrinomonadaceae bacterium]|jgi:peptide/nickel transport system substrate-binding protein